MAQPATRQQLIDRAVAVGAILSQLADDADRTDIKHALAESISLLEAAGRWFEEAHRRLSELGHPPGLKELPDAAAQLGEHAEQLAMILPLLRFMAVAADFAPGSMLATARPAVGSIVAAVSNLHRVLSGIDVDEMERDALAIYDGSFEMIFANEQHMAELERDVEVGEEDSRAGRVVPLDQLVTRLGGH